MDVTADGLCVPAYPPLWSCVFLCTRLTGAVCAWVPACLAVDVDVDLDADTDMDMDAQIWTLKWTRTWTWTRTRKRTSCVCLCTRLCGVVCACAPA